MGTSKLAVLLFRDDMNSVECIDFCLVLLQLGATIVDRMPLETHLKNIYIEKHHFIECYCRCWH
jgi:hypothetical protein